MRWRAVSFGIGSAAAAAGIGGWGSRRAPETYARLDKPGWAPPASVFGPVWSTLYAMIAAAGYRVVGRGDRTTVALHVTQLGLNAAWPIVFFDQRRKMAALAVIVALDAVLAAEIARLARTDRTAALLLAPYAAWSGFATALNAAVGSPA